MSEEGTIEVSFDDLGLTKPLDKMTVKELREMCIEKLPQITGVSGMEKEEIVSTVKEIFGIEDEEPSVADEVKSEIAQIKATIRELRQQRAAETANKAKELLRRKISRLKKKTRRLANSVK